MVRVDQIVTDLDIVRLYVDKQRPAKGEHIVGVQSLLAAINDNVCVIDQLKQQQQQHETYLGLRFRTLLAKREVRLA